MKKISLFLISIIFIVFKIYAQEIDYNITEYIIPSNGKLNVSEIKQDWNFKLYHLKEIKEGNKTYRQNLIKQKNLSAIRFPRTEDFNKSINNDIILDSSIISKPIIEKSFVGNMYNYGIPNDNSIAISNDNHLISVINSNIYFYDMNIDSLMKTISLNDFSIEFPDAHENRFDPRVLYDQKEDRFIIVFLAGSLYYNESKKTDIIVGFSESSDMMGDWNMYTLPGDPLNDTSWTDFPAIRVSEGELFITGNLLDYGTDWQTSFRQSIIWQINKFDGYNGRDLNTKLWKNISFNGEMIRNLYPVKNAEYVEGNNAFFLSNKNFSVYSDTLFLIEITEKLNQKNTKLNISHITLDVGYGMPPDAKQIFTKNVLATNDSRILGGFIKNNIIQFVGNSIDTASGRASIYHGKIYDINKSLKTELKILTKPNLEFGYPNISYSGNSVFSQQAIISFNYTGSEVYPGVSAIFYDGEGGYSDTVNIIEGEYVINILAGNYQRWGDYTGSQRKYNEPGKVWISGMYGNRVNFKNILKTHIAELVSPIEENPIIREDFDLRASLYPNPMVNDFGLEFYLEENKMLSIELMNINGNKIKHFYTGEANKGKNAIVFSTTNLAQGVYILLVSDINGTVLLTEKLVKSNE